MNDDRQGFDQALAQHSNPPTEQVDSAVARVWEALPAEARDASLDGIFLQHDKRRPSRRLLWMIPAAAVALLIAFILVRHAGAPADAIRADVARDLVLPDGSRVELRNGAEVRLESATDGQRIRLNRGSIIVFASKQGSGHLYVQTKDTLVSVVGTVFFVSAEEKGSRVAVFEGEVSVRYGEHQSSLRPGEQLATNPVMPEINLAEEILWSQRATKLLAMLSREERPAAAAPSPPPLPTFQSSKVIKNSGFEVASVKVEDRPPNGFGPGSLQGVACTGRDGAWRAIVSEGFTPFVAPRGRCLTRYTGIQMLLGSVYDIPFQRVIGNLPNWRGRGSPYEAGFQIDAKAENLAGVSTDQLKKMLIDLIIQRFQLKFRREIREGAGAELRIAERASKPRQVPLSESTPPTLDQSSDSEWVVKGKTSMKTLADFISKIPSLSCVVVDKTGLGGIYDYTLTLRPLPFVQFDGSDETELEAKKKAAARVSTGACDTLINLPGRRLVVELRPSLSKSLQQQLGLTLQSARVPVEYIVVDEVSPPTEN